MRQNRTITAGGQKIFVEPWAGGKARLTTSDESIKRVWTRIHQEFPDTLALLTDPDMEPVAEDLEGAISVIVDPERFSVTFDLESMAMGFTIHGGAIEDDRYE